MTDAEVAAWVVAMKRGVSPLAYVPPAQRDPSWSADSRKTKTVSARSNTDAIVDALMLVKR
jgi:hypothetical protein